MTTETLQYTSPTYLGATSGAKTSVLFLGPTRLFFHGGPYKAAGVYIIFGPGSKSDGENWLLSAQNHV